jgi:hypothetical protein
MLVKMKQAMWETLEDRALVWACIEPTMMRARGKSLNVKAGVYHGLTQGQQMLMLFQIFYGHTRSAGEFYWFACDYLSMPNLWERMKEGLRYCECRGLLDVYGEIERLLEPKVKEAAASRREITVLDLEHDPNLRMSVLPLYEKYRAAAGGALLQFAAMIRRNPEEFLEVSED